MRTFWAVGRSRKRVLATVVLAVIACEALVMSAIYWSEAASLRKNQNGLSFGGMPEHHWWKNESQGVVRPKVRVAEEASLREDEEVIGIEVGGQARAYRLSAMIDPSAHVLNDVLDGRPVTVTYCNLSECIRAYTGVPGSGPLDVGVAGLRDAEMVLKIGGVLYDHRSGRSIESESDSAMIPYESLSCERTTWKAWRERHPRTEVYVGEKPR